MSQYFAPESFRVNDLVEGWTTRGHQVSVLTGLPNYPGGRFFAGYGWRGPWSEERCGARVLRVPLAPRGSGSGPRLALNYLSFAVAATVLGLLRCRGPYDAIVVFQPSPVTVGIPAVALRARLGAPLFLWVQDLWPESLIATGAVRARWAIALVAKMVRWLYRRCDLVMVQSEGFVPAVVRTGADPRRVRYLPNWAEAFYQPVELPHDAAERRELGDATTLLFAGNLGAAQSLETILEAAERTRDVDGLSWVLLGDGRRRRWLEDEIARRGLGGSVRWLGSRPAEQMPRWFAAASALLVTLRADPALALTVPSKVQSYLACGRPILAALDGEGARVLAAGGAAIVGPADDAAALADGARRFAAMSAEERDKMGQRARAHFLSSFERDSLLDRLDGWLAENTGPCES